MKVHELLRELQKLPSDAEVVVVVSDDNDAQWFTSGVEKDGNHVTLKAGWPLDKDGYVDHERMRQLTYDQ